MKFLTGLVVLAVGFLLGLWLRTEQLDERVKDHKARADSLVAASDTLKLRLELNAAERAQRDAVINRLKLQIAAREPVPVPAARDTVRVVVDSAELVALVDTLLQEQAQLHSRIAADSATLADYAELVREDSLQVSSLEADLAAAMADNDSLKAVIEATPYQGRCRILDFLPCPTITAGYSALYSEGRIHRGPGATAGWEIKL